MEHDIDFIHQHVDVLQTHAQMRHFDVALNSPDFLQNFRRRFLDDVEHLQSTSSLFSEIYKHFRH